MLPLAADDFSKTDGLSTYICQPIRQGSPDAGNMSTLEKNGKADPRGRKPVNTHLVTGSGKKRLLENLKERMSDGQQAFVICPVIEAAEEQDLKNAMDLAEKLTRVLTPPFRIGLIHGRLPAGERERGMEDFRKGRIDLLVGTTVLEVGVHVPRATVMIIEHPERFGLAQIHQLRGRST